MQPSMLFRGLGFLVAMAAIVALIVLPKTSAIWSVYFADAPLGILAIVAGIVAIVYGRWLAKNGR